MDTHRQQPSDAAFRDAVLKHGIVSVTDTHGKIVLVSDAFCEVTGFAREELLGRTHEMVASGYHDDAHFRQMWSCVSSGQVWRGEFCNRNKRGDEYWVSARILPVRGADDEACLLCFQTDITEYKRTQRA